MINVYTYKNAKICVRILCKWRIEICVHISYNIAIQRGQQSHPVSDPHTKRYNMGEKSNIKEQTNMSTIEIQSKVEALKELESLIEEAKAEAEALRDEIKQEMLIRDTEELSAGQYIIRWTSVLSQRFDSTAFKKVMPDVYKAYTKQIASRRFTIA